MGVSIRNIFQCLYGGLPKLGVPFGGPHNKDYSILESILGSPYSGKLPYWGPPNLWKLPRLGPGFGRVRVLS